MRPADGMGPVELSDSRPYYALVSAVLAGAGVVSTTLGLPMGLTLFLALYALWPLSRALVPRVRVRLTEVGIDDRTYPGSPGLILWADIVDARPSSWGFITLKLREDTRLLNDFSLMQSLVSMKLTLFGRGPVAVHSWALAGPGERHLEAIEDGMDAYALKALPAER